MHPLSHTFDAPGEIDFAGFSNAANDFIHGMPAMLRPAMPGYNSEVLTVVIAALLVLLFSIKRLPLYFARLRTDLLSVRLRDSLFDEHTVNETGIQTTLIMAVCLSEALLMMAWLPSKGILVPPARTLAVMAALIGVAVVYYLWQLLAYNTIAFTFATQRDRRQWTRGFNASQALLGCALLLPALTVMFYPASSQQVIPLCAALYVLARLFFIIKGIRIFYRKFTFTLYFILYLCSVEIVPVIIVLSGALAISHHLSI